MGVRINSNIKQLKQLKERNMRNSEDIQSKIFEVVVETDKVEEAYENNTISKRTYIKRREILDIAYETLMWAAGMSEKIDIDY